MARRTKEEKFDIEVEAALEAALGFGFDTIPNSADKILLPARNDVISAVKADNDSAGRDITAQKKVKTVSAASGAVETALAEGRKIPSFPEAFFSFDDLSPDDKEFNHNIDLQDDVFDLKNLERQIASAAKELNKGNNERAQKIIPAAAADRDSDKTAAEKNYIIIGQAESLSSKKPDKDSAAGGQKAVIAIAGQENAAIGDQAGTAESLEKFLQEQDFQAPDILREKSALSIEDFQREQNGGMSGNCGSSSSQGTPPSPPEKKGFRHSLAKNPLYWIIAAISVLWIVGGISIAYKVLSESGGNFAGFITGAQGFLVTAGTIVPVLLLWGFAQLAHRARELQKIVQIMTGAAQRLLEPESGSKDSVASLGHTIRREVAAMDAGIDRTMSRASELEALLQSEVNNLERSYGENEVRIRSLIAELANEREAVATHADNVKAKITGAKDQLTQEFNSIADHINATAESFTIALSETLNSRWSELVGEFNNANEEVARQLSQKFIDTVQSFDASRGQFFEELDNRFSQIDAHTDAAGKAVAERLGNKMDDFVKIVRERTEEVEGRFETFSGRLADSGNKIIDSVNGSVGEIEQRTQHIETRLQSTADKVLGKFDDKFRELDNAVIDRSNHSLADFSEQIDRLGDRAQDLSSLFDEASQTAAAAFGRHINAAEEKFHYISEQADKNSAALTESILQNLQKAEQRAGEMDARLTVSSKAVAEVFEGKFNALDNLFVDRSNRSIGLFAEQVQKLEKKSQNLSADFDSATQIAVQHFEERLNEVDNLLSHKSTSLIRSFIDKTENLEQSTDKLNTALEMHVERVNEAFRSRASDITASLANGRNDILSIVDETKTRLSHEMEIVGATIGKLVDERAGGFIYQFIEGREKLSNILQNETGRIIDTVSGQMARLSAYVAGIEKNLLERVSDIDSQAHHHMQQIDIRTNAFEKAMTDSFGATRELIETQAHNIDMRADSLRDSLNLNSKELNAVLGEQAAVLEERIAAIRQLVANSDGAFAEIMQRHVAAFGDSVAAGDADLKAIFLTHLERLEGQTGRLKETFNTGSAALADSLEGKIGALAAAFASGRSSIETLLDNHGTIISERALHLQDNLAQTLASVDEKLSKQSEILDKRAYDLRDAVDYNSTVLSDSFLRQTAIIDERAKTVQKTLETGVDNIRGTMEDNAAAFSQLLREHLADISSNFGDETHKAENIISAAAGKLLSSVFDAADNMDQKLANRGLAMSNMLNHTGARLDTDMANIETRLTNIAVSLDDEAEKAGSVITGAGNRLSGSVLQAAEQADKIFADRGVVLQNNLEMVEGRLNYGLQTIQEHMLGTTNEIEQKLNDKSLLFKENLQKIGTEIGSGVDTIRERVTELTHNTMQELVEKTDNLHSLTEQLRNAAARTSDSLANLTGTFSKQLHEVTQAAEERLRQENEHFISNFSGHTEEAVFAVQTAKSELEGQVSRLLEGLENSNSSIQLTVGSLHDNVNEVDKKLSNLTSDFRQNIHQLSESFTASGNVLNEDLRRFNGQSQDALENIAKFSEQFNAHASLLTEATNILANSNTVFSEKLENGRENLDKLANGLVAKSDEIAGAMHNCERVISTVIKNIEDKTWSSTAELRSSLSALISEAAGRFEGATEDIRKSAGEIREELARTQGDLSRGIRGLPMQTKEYTDAMRKAVMDQIEALKDLSGIVEESGLLFDVSRPKAEPQAAAQRPEMRAAQRPAYSANGTTSANTAYAESNGFRKSDPAAPYTAARAVNGAAAAANRDPQSRGWVSDLLARASKEETPHPAAPGLNGQREAQSGRSGAMLNSMSADIVQAIDRDGITKLWQHYRRGQQNISPDSLYTAEGYRVFEDIKQKYAFDGEFRRAVGQYITDFEHLLGDVTRNGGNNGTVREYLTSDTGKVYTMLAHVSGRIQ
ncbi:hypothetical protein [Candidatus Tokpelaia sp.]|uniref:apolipoprotein A-IV repeat region-like domain-containing protein n=1 Tax=Candidatus Tokpelaia sp. TaxID=2233777 RepID=UPI00123B37BC|nr:hypothetical protein [Candidatus Tokpelaia sp.]KAA6404801.1 hypothetical protein DPQ22_07725 [Candidatus Tokpelaia sp.]